MRLEIEDIIRTSFHIKYKERFKQIIRQEVRDIGFGPRPDPKCMYNLEEEIEMNEEN